MAQKKSKNTEVVTINIEPFLTPLAIIISGFMISVALLIGLLNLGNGATLGATDANAAAEAAPTAVVNPAAATTIDNDPFVGSKDSAKVAIVEFTDLECPYCARHHQQVYPLLLENYVASGQVLYVTRDMPLSSHNPVAQEEAIAVECVRQVSGNETAVKAIDEIFTQSSGNGVGVTSGLQGLVADLGVDIDKWKQCTDSEQALEEVNDDVKAASAAGISGTPGFVIGKLDSNGNVDGVFVSGAQDYNTFSQVIEEQLAR